MRLVATIVAAALIACSAAAPLSAAEKAEQVAVGIQVYRRLELQKSILV